MERSVAASIAINVALIGSLTSLYACSGSSSMPSPATRPPANVSFRGKVIEDGEIDHHIDPELPAAERAVMKRIMLQLPKTARENVAYFDTNGENYANHIYLKRTMRRAVHIAGTNLYRSSDGRIFARPDAGAKPGSSARQPMLSSPPTPTPNTGEYRRVLSPPGYAQAMGQVQIPCGTENYPNSGEAGIVMFGGWGVNGQAVDAGLTDYKPGNTGPNESLAVFLTVDGTTPVNGTYNYVDSSGIERLGAGYDAHLQCDQLISMWFWINPDGYLNTQSTGVVEKVGDGSGTQTVTAVNGPFSTSEWPHTGGGSSGIIIKRFVGLAQNPQSFMDRSKFGVDANGNPVVEWQDTYLGTDGSNNVLTNWNSANISGTTYQKYPTCPAAAGVVKTAPVSPYDASFAEYNGILNNATSNC